MKDLLTIIIVLLIVGIVLDGIRRMRLAKRESIALSRNARKADLVESDYSVGSSEFPSGGARVATVRDEKVASSLNNNVRKTYESGRVTAGAPRRIPEQVALNLDESVPMLMDSVEDETEEPLDDAHGYEGGDYADDDATDNYEADNHHTESAEAEDLEYTQNARHNHASAESGDDYNDPREPAIGDFSDLDDDELGEVRPRAEVKHTARVEPKKAEVPVKKTVIEEKPAPQARKEESRLKNTEERKHERNEIKESKESPFQEPDEVLIFNVMAKPGQRIEGAALLQALMDEGLKFGDMDIFHRHKDNDGDGPIIYSIANMVVPGTFNLAEMDAFETPGISMFLSLPVAGESLAAFNDLSVTAKNLANALGAELKDENRSVMTPQTIEHGRQRVIEYERKRKLARA